VAFARETEPANSRNFGPLTDFAGSDSCDLVYTFRVKVLFVVVAALVWTSGVSEAHEFGARVDLPSKFERFVVPSIGIRVLQYYGIGQLEGSGGTVRFRVGRISAVGQASALLALEVRVSGSSASTRTTHAGYIDADDLESLVKALKEMDRMFKKRIPLEKADTAEAEFAAGSVRIGTVLTNRPVDRDRFLIGAGNPPRVTATFDPPDLPKVLTFVSKAIEKIAEVADNSDK
jgi:hypothetical protein